MNYTELVRLIKERTKRRLMNDNITKSAQPSDEPITQDDTGDNTVKQENKAANQYGDPNGFNITYEDMMKFHDTLLKRLGIQASRVFVKAYISNGQEDPGNFLEVPETESPIWIIKGSEHGPLYDVPVAFWARYLPLGSNKWSEQNVEQFRRDIGHVMGNEQLEFQTLQKYFPNLDIANHMLTVQQNRRTTGQ